MANIPLKTIKFPGLDDTYTVPQIDSSFTGVAGEVPDSNKVKGEISSLREDLNHWKDKTIVTFGDSRTWYDGHTYNASTKSPWEGQICKGYQYYMRQMLSTDNIINQGESGNTSVQICARILEYDFTGVDAVLLEGGVNDFIKRTKVTIGELMPIGSEFDTDTIYGAWQSAIEYILNNYPSTQIFVTIPAIAWNNGAVYPASLAQIKLEIANLYGLPCKNLYQTLGINELNRDYYYADDLNDVTWYLHFNDYANEIIGRTLSGFLNDAVTDTENLRVNALADFVDTVTEKSDNLLHLLATTKTVNDVVITTDADNNVLFNGTASAAGGRINKFTDVFILPKGTYTVGQVVTDADSVSSLTRCAVSVQKNVSGSNVIATCSSPMTPVTFTLDEDTEVYVGFNLTKDYVYSNVKMAVMLNAGSALLPYKSPLYLSAIDREYRDSLTALITPYNADDFIYGRVSAQGAYTLAWIYGMTNEFVPDTYLDITPHTGFKMLVVRYKNGVFFDIADSAWKSAKYTLDHGTYQYKIIVAYTDERRIGDLNDVASAISVTLDTKSNNETSYKTVDTVQSNSAVDAFSRNRLNTLMTKYYDVSFANARKALYWKNCYGNSQNMHPKVLYIADGVGGHKYWMAYTPYDFGNVKHENPCITWSDDGYNWTDITANPLANTDNEGDTVYYSDTHLLYTGSRLECWYRKANGNTETIYRRNSPNGINWTDPEEIYSVTINGNALLSPVIIYDNPTHRYRIWVVNSANGYHIDYYEAVSDSITTWNLIRSITLNYTYNESTYNVWHIDVSYIDSKYVLIAMCKGTPWCVFIATSDDNVTYTTPEILLYPNNTEDWDAEMYRSCIIKTDTEYRVYYSARWRLIYGTGVTESNSLEKFIGLT